MTTTPNPTAEQAVAWLAAHDAEVAARQIDAPSVREAIGEVLADMEATAEGTHIASSLALLQEITDAAIRAATSPPSRTAKRTGYETVASAVGEHSQKITARAALSAPQEARSAAKVVPVSYEASASCSHGVCPTGCSHLMWQCSACSCEGGWGASREHLEEIAAQHKCPLMMDEHPFTPEEAARFPRGQRVRRRKAGPWLPVGGDDE